jgi:hypothetical protein
MEQFIKQRVHDYYWQKDFNCANTTLAVLAEIFSVKLSAQITSAAFGLNAGRLGLQCGLVEGSLMFLGVLGQAQKLDNAAKHGLCQKFVLAFQREFGAITCTKLRPEGFSPQNPPHLCEARTLHSIAFSANFIQEHLFSVKRPKTKSKNK